MVVATVLALTSAGLHAGWNLVAKRSADPFIALWGQFFVAGLIAAVVLGATRSLPAAGWGWAVVSGAVHVPYIVALAACLRTGRVLASPIPWLAAAGRSSPASGASSCSATS